LSYRLSEEMEGKILAVLGLFTDHCVTATRMKFWCITWSWRSLSSDPIYLKTRWYLKLSVVAEYSGIVASVNVNVNVKFI